MPPTNDFQPNNVWASNKPSGLAEELTLQSGQTCMARRLGMEGLIAAGILNEADTLTSLVDSKHIRRVRGAKGKPDGDELDARSLLKDPRALASLTALADRALPLIVVSPVVFPVPTDGSDREEGKVYTDQIDLLDKFELFTWSVGSVSDLEPFREKPGASVAGVADGSAVPNTPQRPPRAKGHGKARR